VFDGFPNIQLSFPRQLAWGAVGLLFYVVVNGYFLVKSSQTVGKRLLRLQIVNFTDGSPTAASKIVLARVLPVTILVQIPKIGMAWFSACSTRSSSLAETVAACTISSRARRW